jgi:hypothetical protein
MDPNPMLGIPIHPRMHPNDQVPIGLEILEALRASLGVGHVAETIVGEGRNFKLLVAQRERLSWIAIDPVAALLGLHSRKYRIDESFLTHQPVEGQVFSG